MQPTGHLQADQHAVAWPPYCLWQVRVRYYLYTTDDVGKLYRVFKANRAKIDIIIIIKNEKIRVILCENAAAQHFT